MPDVGLGDQGDEVEHLNRYLRFYGYLPSQRLTKLGLRPVIDRSPQDERRFDEVTQLAVYAYQRRAGLAVTGRLDAATRNQMALRRCGYPDHGGHIKGRSRVAGRWGKSSVGWRIWRYTSQVPQAQARAAVDAAVETWDAACGLTLSMVASNADIWVSWNDTEHGDGYPFVPGEIAHAWPPVSAYDGDLHFDENDAWSSTGAGTAFDVESLALHELGHSLGLDHSENAASVMFAYWNHGQVVHALHAEDIAAIRYLYGP